MAEGPVKWEELSWNNRGEGGTLVRSSGTSPRGAGRVGSTDTEQRKHRERLGLETPVVYAVNDAHWVSPTGFGPRVDLSQRVKCAAWRVRSQD